MRGEKVIAEKMKCFDKSRFITARAWLEDRARWQQNELLALGGRGAIRFLIQSRLNDGLVTGNRLQDLTQKAGSQGRSLVDHARQHRDCFFGKTNAVVIPAVRQVQLGDLEQDLVRVTQPGVIEVGADVLEVVGVEGDQIDDLGVRLFRLGGSQQNARQLDVHRADVCANLRSVHRVRKHFESDGNCLPNHRFGFLKPLRSALLVKVERHCGQRGEQPRVALVGIVASELEVHTIVNLLLGRQLRPARGGG